MLHENVLMADIDVDQWRNAQALLLRSAKACRRLIVIHQAGRVLKFRHTEGLPVNGRVDVIDDPQRAARELYEANQDLVDFVVLMERDAVDSYFAEVQDSWTIEEDLDDYVRKTYAILDSYPDGIVTCPGPARETLGLQWRLGVSYDEVRAAVGAYVEEVRERRFPEQQHTYSMPDEELQLFEEELRDLGDPRQEVGKVRVRR